MTREEQICSLRDELMAAEQKLCNENREWTSLNVTSKIGEPFLRDLLFIVNGAMTADSRSYCVSVKMKYGGFLFQECTRNTGMRSFESVCNKALDQLSMVTIWAKWPIRVPHQKSRAKYFPGERIRSVEELLHEDFVYWGDKITPRGWFLNWNLGMTKKVLDSGMIRFAVRKEEAANG